MRFDVLDEKYLKGLKEKVAKMIQDCFPDGHPEVGELLVEVKDALEECELIQESYWEVCEELYNNDDIWCVYEIDRLVAKKLELPCSIQQDSNCEWDCDGCEHDTMVRFYMERNRLNKNNWDKKAFAEELAKIENTFPTETDLNELLDGSVNNGQK